jgi:hypothetical protein
VQPPLPPALLPLPTPPQHLPPPPPVPPSSATQASALSSSTELRASSHVVKRKRVEVGGGGSVKKESRAHQRCKRCGHIKSACRDAHPPCLKGGGPPCTRPDPLTEDEARQCDTRTYSGRCFRGCSMCAAFLAASDV